MAAPQKSSQVKELMKEKASIAKAETKEAMEVAKANLKLAAGVLAHPFDKDKKAQVKEEATLIKEQAAQEKLARVEQAKEQKQQALGKSHSASVPDHRQREDAQAYTPAQEPVHTHVATQNPLETNSPAKDTVRSHTASVDSEAAVGEARRDSAATQAHPSHPDPTQPVFMSNHGA